MAEDVVHLDDVSWFDAPIPRRRHRCWVQTSGFLSTSGSFVERCPCGATSLNGTGWLQRNSRKGTDDG